MVYSLWFGYSKPCDEGFARAEAEDAKGSPGLSSKLVSFAAFSTVKLML